MSLDLLLQIARVREKARAALQDPGHCLWLPELIRYLDLIEAILRQGPRHPRYHREERQKMLGGFGKIALNDYSFAESELGSEMFAVVNRFAMDKRVDKRGRESFPPPRKHWKKEGRNDSRPLFQLKILAGDPGSLALAFGLRGNPFGAVVRRKEESDH